MNKKLKKDLVVFLYNNFLVPVKRFFNVLKKENGFQHIISLGYNCEVAFRFLRKFRFEESNLFNWTYSHSINDLIFAINNIDFIGEDGFALPNPLWECKKTHIRFHGKEETSTCLNHSETEEEILSRGLSELKSRIDYLRLKFINISKSDETKLYIYKIKKSDITKDIEQKITELYNALCNLGSKNFKLLIIHEKGTVIPSSDLYITRQVEYFAPDDKVVDKQYYNNGWSDIYKEFYPICIKNNNPDKEYKFDKCESAN